MVAPVNFIKIALQRAIPATLFLDFYPLQLWTYSMCRKSKTLIRQALHFIDRLMANGAF
jgi:hypothetical protein